ncbi:MAG: hypothetical protein QNK04_28835 [Myxococcota bacterium]|nr:hypothetical protein [Myxococcota bacterium]
MRRSIFGLLLGATLHLVAGPAAWANYQLFEAGQVRPLAISPDGSTLVATNTPDDHLEIFAIQPDGSLVQTGSVQVGMRPVALAFRTNDEVWVVNHLSDSVSIVDLAASVPRVARTLLVGDEPRAIIFAGAGGNRAFISTARRGQHRVDASIASVPGAGDPQLTTAGIGRADVWVFDATSLGNTVGGTPVEILSFFTDTPRDLAVSPDGNTVYLAGFHTGNETTVINETLIPDGFDSAGPSGGAPGGVPGPDDNANGDPAPETSVIVKFDGSVWRDSLGRNWNALVPFDLPDHDVFSIDANTLSSSSVVEFDHVGTILFNIAVNPASGVLYVTNTELPNHIRFEGAGEHGGSTVQGHLSESRITVIDPSTSSVSPKHLNQHIDYSKLHTDVPDLVDPTQIQHSLATPLEAVVSSDGGTIYVAAFGSAKVGVFDSSDIDDPSFTTNFDPTVESANYIDTGGGPSGLALNEANNRLYVLTRFANQVEVVNLATGTVVATHALHNPEPPSVTEGRPFLYDAVATSGNGEASCSSCHIFGDMDDLAWNLGDPDGAVTSNTQPSSSVLPPAATFHPMKGPMTTQTLRGMATHGGLHWRGDRVDGFFGTDPCTEPSGAPCDEDLSFRNFIVAFEGLVGKDGILSATDMQLFTDFALQLMIPPNPVANLDNSLTPDQQDGANLFSGPVTDTVEECDGCHDLIPSQGFFGSAGEQSFEGEPQNAKVPHMRNLYAKIGMFSQGGDQVRGFGFLHDGSVDTVKNFLEASVFDLNNAEERDLEQFSLAFPSDLAPIVGQQVTLTSTNGGVVDPRIDLLIQRSGASFTSLLLGGAVTECDLVVKGTAAAGTVARGWVREPGGLFRDDLGNTISDAALRALATSEGPLTYTCVPPGSGNRTGIDRDQDTLLNGVETNTGEFVDENDTGSNPAMVDTDGDGFDDDIEVFNLPNATDPNDPLSFPGGPSGVPSLSAIGLGALAGALWIAGGAALRRRREQ